jgi:hypothetical protein
VHVVRERTLAVDLGHREPLAVALLELGDARDVDLLELELLLRPKRLELGASALAEVAIRSVEERDPDYGYRPRVVVASATRCTATPYAAFRIVVPRPS